MPYFAEYGFSKPLIPKMKLKIQNSIWLTGNGGRFLQISMDFAINQGTLVLWIADSNNETKNQKFNMVDTK